MTSVDVQIYKKEIIELYNQGVKIHIIGQKFNINPGTLYGYLKKWGLVKGRTTKRVSDYRDQILQLYNQGKSMEEVAKIVGVSATSISNFYNREGLCRTRFSNHVINDRLVHDEDIILQRYNSGETCADIAKSYDVSYQTISKFLSDRGIAIRQLHKVEEKYDEILDLYRQNRTVCEIARITGFGSTSIFRHLTKLGLDTSKFSTHRDVPLDLVAPAIIDKYISGIGCTVLAKEYNASESSIITLLRRHNVEIRPLKSLFKDESYFQTIDTEDKAYFLGFFIGDVCVRRYHFNLSITDAEIVVALKEYIRAESKIVSTQSDLPNRKPIYSLCVCSKKIVGDLTRLGCMRNKTFKTTFPNDDIVPKNLKRHYLRGLLDADGCISINNRNIFYVSFCGTLALTTGIYDFVKANLGVDGHIYPSRNIFHYKITTRHGIRSFLDYIYADATIYLQRKYRRYQQFLTNYST